MFSSKVEAKYAEAEVKKGEVDLSGIDLTNNYVRLSGEWEYYHNELFSAEDLNSISDKSYGEVPGFWKNYPGQYHRFGYGTYRLVFKLNESQLADSIGLRLNNIHNSYALWLNDSLIVSVGEVGTSYEEGKPKWMPQVLYLSNLTTENELILQVSSYRHRNGGVQDAIEIGPYEEFKVFHKHQMLSEVFLAGCCFVLGCFFIGMFFFWRQDRAALYFGFFSLFFAIRVLIVGTRSMVYGFPQIPWDVAIRLEYISMFAMHYFMFHFVYHAFKKQTNRTYVNVLKVVTSIYIIICLIPGDTFTYLTIPNNYYLLITFVYTIIIFIKALKAGVPGAIWAILSMVLFFFTTIPLVLEYSNLFITDPLLMSIAYIGFMLSIALVFAARFGYAFGRLDELRADELQRASELAQQKEEVEKSNQLIKDSINYAKRIQRSLLPSENKLRTYFKDCFLYFNPQGTVSGDFYWCKQSNNEDEVYIAIADCTGHGVPGAFVSLIAISALDNVVTQRKVVAPNDILLSLNESIYNRLQKNDDDLAVVKDGLDISLCKVNMKQKRVSFASAHHKMIVIKESGELTVYNGDKHHIGMPVNFDFNFQLTDVQLTAGDQVYLFTDGVYDQKGGDDGKKMYLKRLEEFLVSIKEKPMHLQQLKLTEFIEEWKADRVQMDDMLLFSIKF